MVNLKHLYKNAVIHIYDEHIFCLQPKPVWSLSCGGSPAELQRHLGLLGRFLIFARKSVLSLDYLAYTAYYLERRGSVSCLQTRQTFCLTGVGAPPASDLAPPSLF